MVALQWRAWKGHVAWHSVWCKTLDLIALATTPPWWAWLGERTPVHGLIAPPNTGFIARSLPAGLNASSLTTGFIARSWPAGFIARIQVAGIIARSPSTGFTARPPASGFITRSHSDARAHVQFLYAWLPGFINGRISGAYFAPARTP